MVNQKGQSFEVFNLLIGAILALAILVIIISIINYLEEIKVDSSLEAIEQKLKNASQSPDGRIFVSNEVVIPKDYSFNSKQVSKILNISEECVEFDFPQNAKWAVYPNSPERNLVFFPKRIETNFYVVCQSSDERLYHSDFSLMQCPADSCVEFCCLLSFGVNPKTANE